MSSLQGLFNFRKSVVVADELASGTPLFIPSLSFPNVSVSAVVYIRPRYLSIRERYRPAGRLFAVREAIWYPAASPSERHSRASGVSHSAGAGNDPTNSLDSPYLNSADKLEESATGVVGVEQAKNAAENGDDDSPEEDTATEGMDSSNERRKYVCGRVDEEKV